MMSLIQSFAQGQAPDDGEPEPGRCRVGRWRCVSSACRPRDGRDTLEIWYGKRWEVVMRRNSNGVHEVFSSLQAALTSDSAVANRGAASGEPAGPSPAGPSRA
jgi:hypothetical protein